VREARFSRLFLCDAITRGSDKADVPRDQVAYDTARDDP